MAIKPTIITSQHQQPLVLQALGRSSRAIAIAAGVPPSIVSKNHRAVCPQKQGARISRPPAPRARTSWVRGRPRPHVSARCGVCGAGRPTRQRSRGWRRAGETPAHPSSPHLRRDRARRTSWVGGRPRPHVSARGGVCGEGRPNSPAFARMETCGRDARAPRQSAPSARAGAAHFLGARASPPARLGAARRLRGGGPHLPAFARMETCGRDARAPKQRSVRRGYTRKAFMASSPRQLTTFTAMRPEAGRGKGREASLFSAAQASGSISAFREVFSALYGSFPPRK